MRNIGGLIARILAFMLFAAGTAFAAAPPAIRSVDFASGREVLELKTALLPYHAPGEAERDGSRWYAVTVTNNAPRPVTRILQAGPWPDIGLRLFPASTRPEILQTASSDGGVNVEPTNAYGRKTFRVTIPPATTASLALRVLNTRDPPSLLAWTEPAIAAHNRQLAIFFAAVAGLIAAATLIIAGEAVMTGHGAPQWTAIFLGLILFQRLSTTGIFDASLATGIGGPYGLSAMIACFALVAGLRLTDMLVPLKDTWPLPDRALEWTLRGLSVLALVSFLGLPGAALAADVCVLLGTITIAYHLVARGRAGARAARIAAPNAVVFALVAIASAVAAFGGFGDNIAAPAAIGGFVAVGAVLLALAIAAGEGLAAIPRPMRAHAAPLDPDSLDAIGAAHQGVFDLDFATDTVSFSAEGASLLAMPCEPLQMPHPDWLARVHPEDRAIYAQALSDYRGHPAMGFRMEFRVRSENGRYPWLELRATMFGDEAPAARCLGLIADVSARRETEAASGRVLRDRLTGLGNRIALIEMLEKLGEGLKGVTFALLDIDRFKAIHSSLGDTGADAVLVDLAQRLTKRFAGTAEIFRVGGDAFALVFRKSEAPAEVGAELIEMCNAPHMQGSRSVFAPASVGVSIGAGAEDPLDLLKNAELALIQAKRQGGGCARVFTRDFVALAPRDSVGLEEELRNALNQRQLDIFYQPIIRLSDSTVAGFEALLRWHHPVKGIVAPSDFIAHSETSGLIVSLGRFALERASHDLANWQNFFPLDPPLFVSVNVARRQLHDTQFEELLSSLIAKGHIRPGTLKLEVTESAIGAVQDAREALEHLHSLGAGLAIDDFGTGLSSLSQLKDMPFDTVKIDKSFLSRHGGTDDEGEGVVILNSIVTMAHELKREVIVEGVETERDANWLKEIGCEFAQGFYFSPPLSAAEALNFIALYFDLSGQKRAAPSDLEEISRPASQSG
ncbi:MAG TPA: GGDEF and EAL domain-containing protein [Rhizomicrobium sp.]|nr:GGDEF and EAL domain-containing protein [Rhizomicrobium sp.]